MRARYGSTPRSGQLGRDASEHTDAKEELASYHQQQQASSPLDLRAFNIYHHGGKVQKQDHDFLREVLRRGEAEGAQMPALRSLVAKLPAEQS